MGSAFRSQGKALSQSKGLLISTLRYRYHTYEVGEYDIHIRSLKNRQQFLDEGDAARVLGINSTLWSFFGVIWDSSQILAHHMCAFQIEGKKILEIGCGLGLTSLLLSQRMANITCTDYHPEAEKFLQTNIALNTGRAIPFFRADWAKESTHDETFDLILGSDLLYESGHHLVLPAFIERHAKDTCDVILVDSNRGYLKQFTAGMKALSFSCTKTKPVDQSFLLTPFRGSINPYKRDANLVLA
jgi:predicted nicotinamide N-methyase